MSRSNPPETSHSHGDKPTRRPEEGADPKSTIDTPSEEAKARNTYRRVRDLMERVADFRKELSRHFETTEKAEDERAQRLIDFMARHEEEMRQRLEEARTDEDAILDTWLQYVPTEPLDQAMDAARPDNGMDLDDVIEKTLEVDRRLRDLYRQLAGNLNAPSAKRFFEALAERMSDESAERAWAYHASEGA